MGYRTYTCPIARTCGGCEWLAVPYPIQLRRKRDSVQQLINDALGPNAPQVDDVLGMEEPVAFRHKAATPFAPGKKGQLRCGFYAAGTHRIVRCDACLVEPPGTRAALFGVARAAREHNIAAYHEDSGSGLLRHAVLRLGWKTNEALLTVVVNNDRLPRERAFAERVRDLANEAFAQAGSATRVSSVVLNVNQRRTNAILGHSTRALLGSGVMHDELLGCRFEIGPTSFYQTNPQQTEVLYQQAIKAANLKSGMRLLDAYCGTGTIGLTAAHATDDLELLGVERTPEAVACARRNAEANGLAERSRFVAADATDWISAQVKADKLQADVVILDPPRAGSTEAFLASVCALAPKRVVYVSCNPVTLVRDLAYLVQRGWQVARVTPVDFFPHTKHVETVVLLTGTK